MSNLNPSVTFSPVWREKERGREREREKGRGREMLEY